MRQSVIFVWELILKRLIIKIPMLIIEVVIIKNIRINNSKINNNEKTLSFVKVLETRFFSKLKDDYLP